MSFGSGKVQPEPKKPLHNTSHCAVMAPGEAVNLIGEAVVYNFMIWLGMLLQQVEGPIRPPDLHT
jgi:hypothetical protein